MGESDKEKLRIRLHVYDTDMTVTIPRAEEECYRAAAKLITDVVNNYSAVYKDRKGEKEILYMALIDISLRYQKETRYIACYRHPYQVDFRNRRSVG